MATFSGKLDQLLKIARAASSKEAFVDPAAMAGGGASMDPAMDPMAGGAPPADPMAGGAPPMDPAMMGMDPSMMGGAPPMDPMMGGMPPMDPAMMGMDPAMMGMDPAMMGGMPPLPPEGGGGITAEEVRTIIQEEMSSKSESKSTGSSKQNETDGALKQINFLLAKIADVLGISISAQDIVEAPEEAAPAAPAAAPAAEAGPQSTFANIDPMEAYPTAVKTSDEGTAYDAAGLFEVTNKAASLAHVLKHRKNRK